MKGKRFVTKTKLETEFVPGRGYGKPDWDEVSEDTDSTTEEIASMRPAREVLPPEFFEMIERERKKRGRPVSPLSKRQVTLRLDADVIESFKTDGAGWQSRINAALRKARGL